MNIPFVDFKREYFSIKKEIDEAVLRVLSSGWYILGKEVESFESEFADYCGLKYCVTVNSGTNALYLALWALGICAGEEVIVPANSFISSALAVSYLEATPVFADVEEDSFNINPLVIEKLITSKTKAIMPVHLCGRISNMEPILKIAKKYNLYVIEDACQAHGASYKGKKAGSFGDITAYSFYPTKNLGGYGDGGALVTNKKSIKDKLLLLRNYGQTKKYFLEIIGLNSRLDEIQAAVLRVKLKHLDSWVKKRREIAGKYNYLLKGLPIILPKESDNEYHSYYLYMIRTKQIDELQGCLARNGISTLIHYPIPIHLQRAYKFLDYKRGSIPVVEMLSKEILSLPMFPELTDEEIKYVCEKIKEFFKK